jgi:hypothetical protein
LAAVQLPQKLVDVFRFVSHPFEATPSQLPKPVEHVETVQAPLLQPGVAFASEHAVHVAPLVPQLLPDWLANASQVVPLQQPDGQDDPLQTQVPALPHVCPLPHVPHAAPPAPQLVADWLA